MEIEDKEAQNMDILKEIRQKPKLQSSQNILRVWDALILLFYCIMSFSWDYKHLEGYDAQYFVGLFLTSIIWAQIFIFLFGFTTKFVNTEDKLSKWIFIRQTHNAVTVILFLLLFISGYHEIFGFIIFIASCPTLFFWSNMWMFTIRFDEIAEKQGLMKNKEPAKFGTDGFNQFEDEHEK